MFLVGRGNHLRRASRPPQFLSGTEDPIFPIERAFDHRTGSAAMFDNAALATDSKLEIDKDVLVNGDFENDPLDGWTVSGGTLTRDTGTFHTGAAAGVTSGMAYQDHPAVPGELWAGHWAIMGTSGDAVISVRNLHTGRWLKGDGTWTDAQTDLDTQVGATWKDATIVDPFVFTVEPYSACRLSEVTLRVTIMGSGGEAHFDEIAFWPCTDLAGVFGYNRPPGGLVPRLFDGAEAYEKRFAQDGQGILWAYLGECKSYRRWRFEWTGTPLAAIGFGELVLSQTTRIARWNVPSGVTPRLDMELEPAFPQERATAPSGALYVAPNGGDVAPRRATMSFMLTSEAELVRLRDEIFAASQGGLYPSILVGPTAIGSEVCMFGRLDSRLPQVFPGGPGEVYAKVEVPFLEDVFPYYRIVLGVLGEVPA